MLVLTKWDIETNSCKKLKFEVISSWVLALAFELISLNGFNITGHVTLSLHRGERQTVDCAILIVLEIHFGQFDVCIPGRIQRKCN